MSAVPIARYTVTARLRFHNVVVANLGVKVQLLQPLCQTALWNDLRFILLSTALSDLRYRIHGQELFFDSDSDVSRMGRNSTLILDIGQNKQSLDYTKSIGWSGGSSHTTAGWTVSGETDDRPTHHFQHTFPPSQRTQQEETTPASALFSATRRPSPCESPAATGPTSFP